MNIENKKTALDDDSILYQKRGDKTAKKEDIKHLSGKEKLRYFKDYYLKIVIALVIIAIFIGSLINSTVFNRQTNVLSLVYLNECYLEDTQPLEDSITETLSPEGKNDYISVSYYNTEDYQQQMAYSTQLMGGGIDLIICPEEYFEEGSGLGVFADLSEILPEDLYKKLSDKILESSEAETDNYGEVLSYYEAKPHGIDLADTSRYKEFSGYDTHAILGVSANAKNLDNIIAFIEWFTSE